MDPTMADMLDRARRRLPELVGDAFLFVDEDGAIVDANDAASELYGYSQDELRRLSIRDLRAPATERYFEEFLKNPPTGRVLFETVQMRSDGAIVSVEISATSVVSDTGRLYIGAIRDISARKAAEEELRLKSLLLDSTTDSVLVHYVEGEMIYVNEAACSQRGFTREEMLALGPYEWVEESARERVVHNLDRLLRKGSLIFESLNVRKDGTTIPFEYHSSVIELGGRIALVSIGRDITERVEAEKTIRHMAYHDNLTGLPNRKLLQDRMDVALANARRYEDLLAVVFLDLDGFKEINDARGHAAGDRALAAVAERLAGCLREGDTLARLGGDEFIVLLPRVNGTRDAMAVADKILQLLRPAFVVDDVAVTMSASVGVAVTARGEGTPDVLLHRADVAMYRAKQAGGDRAHLYEPGDE